MHILFGPDVYQRTYYFLDLSGAVWNILGYLLFCDRSQNGVTFRDSFGRRLLSDNHEAVVLTKNKKATKFGLSAFTGGRKFFSY